MIEIIFVGPPKPTKEVPTAHVCSWLDLLRAHGAMLRVRAHPPFRPGRDEPLLAVKIGRKETIIKNTEDKEVKAVMEELLNESDDGWERKIRCAEAEQIERSKDVLKRKLRKTGIEWSIERCDGFDQIRFDAVDGLTTTILVEFWHENQMGAIIRNAKSDFAEQRKFRRQARADEVKLSEIEIFLDRATFDFLKSAATDSSERMAIELDTRVRTPSGGIARIGADIYLQLMSKAGKEPEAWWRIWKDWTEENRDGA